MVAEIRDIDGVPHVYIDRSTPDWSFCVPRKFSLAPEAIEFREEGGRKFMSMYGEEYEFISPNGAPPTVYIWAAFHVNFGNGTQFYDFRAQANFIKEKGPAVVLHEFFHDAVYDPADGSCSRHGVFPRHPLLGLISYSGHIRHLRSYDHDRMLEEKLSVDLADMLGHKLVGCDINPHGTTDEDLKERETEHADVIEAFNGTPERPNIAIIGGDHSRRPNAHLLHCLTERGIAYAVVANLGLERMFPPEDVSREESLWRYVNTLE